jgi:hypothetical protein
MPRLSAISGSLRRLHMSCRHSTTTFAIRRHEPSVGPQFQWYKSSTRLYSSQSKRPVTKPLSPGAADARTVAVDATPEALKKVTPPIAKQDTLLQEKLVSNAEQRKADWAIIKEMSRYLWPKVDNLTLYSSLTYSDTNG